MFDSRERERETGILVEGNDRKIDDLSRKTRGYFIIISFGKLIKSFRFLSFLLSNYISVDLLKLGEIENNSVLPIIHLRVPWLEDLDNGNRM